MTPQSESEPLQRVLFSFVGMNVLAISGRPPSAFLVFAAPLTGGIAAGIALVIIPVRESETGLRDFQTRSSFRLQGTLEDLLALRHQLIGGWLERRVIHKRIDHHLP